MACYRATFVFTLCELQFLALPSISVSFHVFFFKINCIFQLLLSFLDVLAILSLCVSPSRTQRIETHVNWVPAKRTLSVLLLRMEETSFRCFFFKFAFIVFNPCFTNQVYHGVFTEFYNELLQWCLRCTWRVSSDLVQIQVFCDFTPCRKSIVPPAVDEVCLWLCKLISRFFHRNFQHDRN